MQRSATAVAAGGVTGAAHGDSKRGQAEQKVASPRQAQVVVTAMAPPSARSAAEGTAVAMKEAARPPSGLPSGGTLAVTPPPQSARQGAVAVTVAATAQVLQVQQVPHSAQQPPVPPPPAPPMPVPTSAAGAPPPRQQGVAPGDSSP